MEYLTIKEACDLIHCSESTLRRWEEKGYIQSVRTKGGHRRYSADDLRRALGEPSPRNIRITIAYCRVSSSGQKDDLNRQVEVVSRYCEKQGYRFKVITDVGSGLNYNKKGLDFILREVCLDHVDRIVVNYKDRLVRFGFDMIKTICDVHGTEIEIINETDEVSYEKELVDDVLSIITVFSAKLYGKRSHKSNEIVSRNKEMFRQE